ncbi:hypothetical protein ABE493_11060 [Stenotrophomonas terrae]|uniref:hypothetical protein n=1 Tax=Stenotrophomonas terrae TaxID=405446 RepID=UPI00320AA364
MKAQLFHTRHIMSSVLVGLLLMAGGCVQINQRDQPVTAPSLPAYVVLKLASGERRIDQGELEAIQHELVAALQRQLPQADYAILAEEARQATRFIGPDHVARIGLWTLQVRAGRPVLVRQQLPRAAVMLSHIAHLTEKDGRWIVQSLALEKLRGR